MSALVIKSWRADSKPVDDKNNHIRIVGRNGGLIAWLLSLMGIDPTTTILVGPERIEFSSASLAGTESRLIPMQNVCSTYYGYHKPWKAGALIVAFFLLGGLSAGASVAEAGSPGSAFTILFTAVVVGLAFALLYYFLNRTLTLGFVELSGVVCGIRFKRSAIENVDVDQVQAKAVCTIVQQLIEAKSRRLLADAKP